MNRKLLFWGLALTGLALNALATPPVYEFATVSNSVTAGANLSAVANSGNVFVCVGANNSPVFSVNSNNFTAFAATNSGGGYLLVSNAWTRTAKNFSLNCVAVQPNGFIASGASNAVYLSADGVNWNSSGRVLNPANNSIAIDGIAYNPNSGTYAAAQAIYNASFTTNPPAMNGWQSATVNGQSFAESYRAVAAFAGSNMAMCGILGDIRVSPDGGRTWNIGQQANLNYPNLLSVASDGGSNLVSAGDFSMLEVSTNGGPTASSWKIQTNMNFNALGSVTNFNAVAYNSVDNSFFAAGALGANGLIAMAFESPGSAQWTWRRQTNLYEFQNGVLVPIASIPSALNGAAFASSNFFQGISMFVGGSGALVVGGYAPPSPSNLVNVEITNILSNPPANGALTATVNSDANHPANVLTVDWFASPTGGAPVALNAISYQPTNANVGTYTNWAQERDLRTGFASASRVPFVFSIVPGAPGNPVSATNCGNINGLFGMCDITPMSVTVVTNGANPPGTIKVDWYDGSLNLVAADTFTAGSDIASFAPTNLTSPGIYTYYAQATNPASGLASATMTPLTYQINALPQWTTGLGFATNALLSDPQTNPVIANPDIGNVSQILGIEPSATVVYDWYTNSDPTVATYDNPNAPFALTEVAGFPGVVEPATAVPFIPTNVLAGTYTYYVRARVVDPAFTACKCESTNLVAVTFILSPPAPVDAVLHLTNVLTGATQTNTPVWVDVLTNVDNPASSFAVNWFSAPAGSNGAVFLNDGTETNLSNRFFHTPTNAVCGVFTNWAETVATKSGSGGPVTSTNRTPVVFVIVPATPLALTSIAAFDQTNCIEIANPTFTVAVTNGQTANWYPASGGLISGPAEQTGTLSYTPTNSSAGTFEFAALAVDPGSGLTSTGMVLATLSLYDCTNPVSISLNPSTGTGTIQWPGNLTLLSTTNLTPPVIWTSVSTGSMFLAPNTFTFTNTNPPVEFFRLTN